MTVLLAWLVPYSNPCMDTTISLFERLLLDLTCMFGLLLFAAIVLFPSRFEGIKNSQRLERCSKCGKWNKSA